MKEILEEAAERLYPENWESIMEGQHDSNSYERNAFIKGSKWQMERSYSEEEVINLLYIRSMCQEHYESDAEVREWFNKFKKK